MIQPYILYNNLYLNNSENKTFYIIIAQFFSRTIYKTFYTVKHKKLKNK